MLPEDSRRRLLRRARFESFEQRLALSANPVSDLPIFHHNASLVSPDGVPPLEMHVAEVAPPLEHHALQSVPPLEHHNGSLSSPPLEHHEGVQSDFILEKVTAIGSEQVETHLSSAHQATGANQARTDYGFDGTGQTVAIIDSGIAYDHENLGAGYGSNYRVVGGYDFAEQDSDPYDDGPAGFHGTHVAGIVGSDHATHRGVAEGVDLVALRVFDDDGNGVFSWVEQALQWVHDNKDSFDNPITTVNLSLGTTWNSDSIPSWANLEDELQALEEDGIFISVSAGNSFSSYNTTGLSYPAASPYVVPVMSVTDSGTFSSFSQRHQRGIAAPGSNIVSTVPDYVFGADGVHNDFGQTSGTSMSAPYLAGASVLVRQAMEFMGTQNITQDVINNHLRSTADSFFDTATNASYLRLNLGAAIDAIMPDDDFGSSLGEAHDLGTVGNGSSFNGLIGKTSDLDYFQFTAAATGTLSLDVSTTHSLDVTVSSDGSSNATFSNGTLSMDVIAGDTYTVSLGTTDGIGNYSVNASMEMAATDWDTVDFAQHNGLVIDGSSTFRVAATRSGMFTVESFFDHASGNIDLALYDSDNNLVEDAGSATSNERLDATVVGGNEYTLVVTGTNSDVDFRLTNLFSFVDNQGTLHGTSGDDTLVADARNLSVTINGVVYQDDGSTINPQLTIDLGDGDDSAVLHGTANDEQVTIRVGSVSITGGTPENTFALSMTNVEDVEIHGNGGHDTVDFHDGIGNDRYNGDGANSSLTGQGFSHRARDFDQSTAHSTSGNDVAFLYDTSGNDVFRGRESSSVMTRSDGVENEARGFSRVNAYSTGGSDTAFLYDSGDDERLIAKQNFAAMIGNDFFNYAQGFNRVNAYALGGNDTAFLHDSTGNDRFVGKDNFAFMHGSGFLNYTQGFDRVNAYATSGGFDTAYLHDSVGNDRFVGKSNFSFMHGDGYLNYAGNFDRVNAFASNGVDTAFLHDSVGNDRFVGKSNFAFMHGSGFLNYTSSFDRVNAYATGGGVDTAFLHDSAGNDRFVGKSNFAFMHGSGFLNYTESFDRVNSYASGGGFDTAYLHDSVGNDRFVGKSSFAFMSGNGFLNYTERFDRVNAYSNSGTDTAYLYDSNGNDTYTGNGSTSSLSGSTFNNSAHQFDNVQARAVNGGNDVAYFNELGNNDTLYGRSNEASVSNGGSSRSVFDFDSISGNARSGESPTADVDAVDYLFEQNGTWQ